MANHRPNWITDMDTPLPVAKVIEHEGNVGIRLKNWDVEVNEAYAVDEIDELIHVLTRAKEDALRLREAMITDDLYSNMIFGEISDV